MLRLYLEKELEKVAQDLEMIWNAVLGQYEVLLNSPTESQIKELIDHDALINEAVMNLDKKCQTIICLQHPVAGDLRRLVTMMKLSTDIERIGDRIVGMARTGYIGHGSEDWQEIQHEVKGMQLAVRDQLVKALTYFKNLKEDKTSSKDFEPSRTEIAGYYEKLEDKILQSLTNEINKIVVGRDLLHVIQHLDKISHLIKSMYRWMDYQKSGEL